MSEPEQQTLSTEFMTLHYSGSDVHLRTRDGILFIDKGKAELIEKAARLRRGQRITVRGPRVRSKTLSTEVIAVEALDAA